MESSPRRAAKNSTTFKSMNYARRVIATLMVVTLVNLSLPGVFAAPIRDASTAATGVIRVAGIVEIDGMRGSSGQTVFPGSKIVTREGSESIIDLGKFTRLRLSAETDFTLDFSHMNISGTLDKGAIRGFIPAGLPVNIRIADWELVTDPTQPAEFMVQLFGDVTKLSVEKGRVELRSEDKLQTVSAGEVFTTASASQTTTPDEQDGLTDRQKVGLFAAIGAAALILALALTGDKKGEEAEFGDCVIILSGPGSSCL